MRGCLLLIESAHVFFGFGAPLPASNQHPRNRGLVRRLREIDPRLGVRRPAGRRIRLSTQAVNDGMMRRRGGSEERNEDYARFRGLFHYFIDRNFRNLLRK